MDASQKLIGEYLIGEKKITPGQLQNALEIQANSIRGGKMPLLGTILVELGAVEERDLAETLARQERDRKEFNPAEFPTATTSRQQ